MNQLHLLVSVIMGFTVIMALVSRIRYNPFEPVPGRNYAKPASWHFLAAAFLVLDSVLHIPLLLRWEENAFWSIMKVLFAIFLVVRGKAYLKLRDVYPQT